VQADGTAVRFDDLAHDRQSQTAGAIRRPGPLEDLTVLFDSNTRAGVLDRQPSP
jgi:hypothetical protein